jgi:hypothetical protein
MRTTANTAQSTDRFLNLEPRRVPAVCNNRGDLIVADRKEDGRSGAGVMYNTRTGMVTCQVP